jgi:LmbE family N-acetylglucosaminyl deacetylase
MRHGTPDGNILDGRTLGDGTLDRVEPLDANLPGRPRIDVSDAGPAETSWGAVIEQAALPHWQPGAAGTLLVVSPHPDDETLAVGGLLHDLVAAGWRVRLASVSDGEAAYPTAPNLGAVRRRELSVALGRLGIAEATVVHRFGLPDGRIATRESALATGLLPLAAGAAWILAPWADDGHPDHEACGRAAAAVARDAGTAIRFFPIWAWHWAEPGSPAARAMLAAAERHDLSPRALHAKRAALAAFESQQSGVFGPAVLPSHVLDRFARPFEVLLR